MGLFEKAKTGISDFIAKNKANNLADTTYEKAHYKFVKTESKLPAHVYGKVDVVNNKFHCKSSDKIKEGIILKGNQDNNEIKFNITQVFHNQEKFEHGIEFADEMTIDICDIQILK